MVPSKTLEDLAVRRIFAADDDVAYVSERDDVQGAAVGLWRSEHAFGIDALTEVEAAAAAASQAKLRLEDARDEQATGRVTRSLRRASAITNLIHTGAVSGMP